MREFFRRHVLAWWTICVAVIAFIAGLLKIYTPLTEWSAHWLQKQIIQVKPNSYQISETAASEVAWLLVILVFLMLAVAYSVWSLWRSEKIARQSDQKNRSLETTFKQTMNAAGLIAEKISPGPKRILKNVLEFRQSYTLFDNGDCQVSETSLLTAKHHDVHLMAKSIEPEAVADPAYFPGDIALQIESGTPDKGVAYLINKNEPHEKRFVIFFLPAMKSDGTDQRELTISFYWKGYLRKLVTEGEEEISYSVKSVDPIPKIEYSFWVKPGVGRLNCTNVGGDIPDAQFENVEDKSKGMKGVVFRANNVPGDYTVKLLLHLEH